MRILYVAKHKSGGNDDEGSIAYALEQLGHDVVRVNESVGVAQWQRTDLQGDLLLFHKWEGREQIRTFPGTKVFWFFDRVIDGPWEVKRRAWMERVLPCVDAGFCTDGDYVAEDRTSKLVWLPQGADERIVGWGTPDPSQAVDVLCVAGTRWHGDRRKSFVDRLAGFCREQEFTFRHVEEGVYRKDLRDLVASAKVVVAPDWPVSDRYCSNRIFNIAGFGAYLLHPECKAAESWYRGSFEASYYRDWHDLKTKLTFVVTEHQGQAFYRGLKDRALSRTLSNNLYRHRCEELIRIVQERVIA